MSRKYKWLVEFSVDETWVADGFDLTKERALDMLRSDLRFASAQEVGARIVVRPLDADIAKAQGFETAKEFRAART